MIAESLNPTTNMVSDTLSTKEEKEKKRNSFLGMGGNAGRVDDARLQQRSGRGPMMPFH